MDPTISSFELTARLFKSRVNRYAVIGTGIALLTVAVATLLACGVERQGISLDGLLAVQKTNPALWLLDLTPFAFALWGQYTGSMMAYQASALVQDETAELRKKASALEYQIEHGQVEGPRLGLPNRRALRSALSQSLAQSGNRDRWPAILMIEIDQLRDVDRVMGDEIAEDLMRLVTQRLQNLISREQVLAYLGHSEFGLLSVGLIDAEDLQRQAQRIHRALDTPVTLAGMQISLQARIGGAIGNDDDRPDAESLLRRAEIAKYAARTEQNDFQLYESSLETRRAGRLSLTAELHSSLGNDGLELAYAPQVKPAEEAGKQQYSRVRLYPRWLHPRRGLMQESEFLNLPERGGLLHSLSLWLLQQGLNRLEHQRQVHDPARVMVIRLPEQALARLPLSEMLTRLLSAHDLPGAALVLEFSEASLREGGRNAVRHLDLLSQQGVGICLVGLGSPQCGLATLLDFPINEVSLSASLTQRAQHEPRAALLVRHYVTLAHEMGLECGAGDVSSYAQLEMLQSVGCDWLEGPVLQAQRDAGSDARWLPPTTADENSGGGVV